MGTKSRDVAYGMSLKLERNDVLDIVYNVEEERKKEKYINAFKDQNWPVRQWYDNGMCTQSSKIKNK